MFMAKSMTVSYMDEMMKKRGLYIGSIDQLTHWPLEDVAAIVH